MPKPLESLPLREAVGYLIYHWDATTDPEHRAVEDYLLAAGEIISHTGAQLDTAWEIADRISTWDVIHAGHDRTRRDYLEIADLVLEAMT